MAEFRKLAKDVYVFLQPPLIGYSSAGVIIGDRDVIVVESPGLFSPSLHSA